MKKKLPIQITSAHSILLPHNAQYSPLELIHLPKEHPLAEHIFKANTDASIQILNEGTGKTATQVLNEAIGNMLTTSSFWFQMLSRTTDYMGIVLPILKEAGVQHAHEASSDLILEVITTATTSHILNELSSQFAPIIYKVLLRNENEFFHIKTSEEFMLDLDNVHRVMDAVQITFGSTYGNLLQNYQRCAMTPLAKIEANKIFVTRIANYLNRHPARITPKKSIKDMIKETPISDQAILAATQLHIEKLSKEDSFT